MPRPGRGLLDTSTFLLLPQLDQELLPEEAVISAITLAELSLGPLVAQSDPKRAARQAEVQVAESEFTAIAFDAASARAFAGVAASLRRAGRKARARTFDALIAAVAVAYGLTLYSCNPQDFAGVEGLDLVAIPHPGREEDR